MPEDFASRILRAWGREHRGQRIRDVQESLRSIDCEDYPRRAHGGQQGCSCWHFQHGLGRAWRRDDAREVVRDEDRSRSIRYGRRGELSEIGGEMGFLEDPGSRVGGSDIFRHQWRKADGVEFVVMVSN